MNLPKKVREQGEAADAALQALKDGTNPLGGPVTPAPAGEGAAATPPGSAEPPAPATPEGTPSAGEIDWKTECEKAIQRYNVLNGKYQAEVPVLHEEIRLLKIRLGNPESGGNPPADPGTPAAAASDIAVPEDIKEMYGDNLPQWVQDVAKAAATAAVAPLANKVDNISTTSSENRGQSFFDAINTAHSDWETINGLEAFKSFLAETIPELGIERQGIIEKAQADLDPKPIIAQITLFKERYKAGSEQTRLASQVVPEDTGSGPAPTLDDDTKIKESEIADFYARAAKGQYRGNPKEFKRLEDMIRKAAESNNIVFDVTPPGQMT